MALSTTPIVLTVGATGTEGSPSRHLQLPTVLVVAEEGIPRPLLLILREHLAIATSLALFLVIVIRLLLVAHGDLNSALGVVRAAGTAEVFVAISIEILPALFATVTVYLFAFGFWPPRGRWTSLLRYALVM